MATWHDTVSIRLIWSNAPAADPLLQDLLDAAKAQVIAYAPALVDPAVIPATYRVAHGLQTRAIWESQTANVAGDVDAIGLEGYQVRVYSLAKPVRELLRPPNGVPVLG